MVFEQLEYYQQVFLTQPALCLHPSSIWCLCSNMNSPSKHTNLG